MRFTVRPEKMTSGQRLPLSSCLVRVGDAKSTQCSRLLPSSLQHGRVRITASGRCAPELSSPLGKKRGNRNSRKVPQSFVNSWKRSRLRGTVHSLTAKHPGTFSPQIPMRSHQETFFPCVSCLHFLREEIGASRPRIRGDFVQFSITTNPGSLADISVPLSW